MKWGDYIEDTALEQWDIVEDARLLCQQIEDSVPLEGFDMTRPFKIGWYIEQEEHEKEV